MSVITFDPVLRSIEKKCGVKFNMSITDTDIRRTEELFMTTNETDEKVIRNSHKDGE